MTLPRCSNELSPMLELVQEYQLNAPLFEADHMEQSASF